MAPRDEIREHVLKELKKIILDTLEDQNVKVYLFGSWARNEEKHSSDIDIAIESQTQLSSSKWIELHDKIEESVIPYRVDLVHLNNASSDLIQNVKKEGVIWKDYENA